SAWPTFPRKVVCFLCLWRVSLRGVSFGSARGSGDGVLMGPPLREKGNPRARKNPGRGGVTCCNDERSPVRRGPPFVPDPAGLGVRRAPDREGVRDGSRAHAGRVAAD